MARIDKATIDKILDVTNIVDVVCDFVSLKKRGSSYLGLCPFHNERTPSFSVSGSRGIFKCFSCGKAGTALSFLMDLEHMSYVEAIKWLGKKYGIEVQEREMTSVERQAEAERESMFAANEFALNHFESTLTDTDDGHDIGLSYFRERGINDAMIKKFHLGYALEASDDLYNKAKAAGFEDKALINTGLCIRTDRGRVYDRFKGRVIYPVHSLSGRVVAFGGRTLSKEKTVAKYVNSPESLIYSKSNEIYGIYQARNAIAKTKTCILVEGYMDVISMHQAGVENVVASSGTSLTDGQIRMIKRFADKVVLIYDSDPAGIKAALRGIDMLIAAGISLKIVLLPEGEDPDSFAQNHSSAEVLEYIAENEKDLIGFKVDVLMKESAGDPRKHSEAINNILGTISIIPDVVEQSLYIDECAAKVGIKSDILAAQVKKMIAKHREDEYKRKQQEHAAETIADIVDEPSEIVAPTAPVAPTVQISPEVLKAEAEIIRYVVRYGMLDFGDVVIENPGEDPKTVQMSVIDYIENEFISDNISFQDQMFAHIWSIALQLRNEQWQEQMETKVGELQIKRANDLAAGQEEICRSGLNKSTIESRERELLTRLDAEYFTAIDRFASAFIRDKLIRSTDRRLTDMVAEMTADPVVLSKMHPKTDLHQEVRVNVPLAINILKSVLIKEEINRLCEQLATTPKEQIETINSLVEQICRLKSASMQFDKSNGEIVIKPHLSK